ncbi:hypothetical protein TB1_002804 [Malus domestica]
MDFASIQTQLANLTSQLSQYAERTTMQSVPTFGASYRQGYQANQCPQRDWSDHSNSMWWEAQQVQHEGYWQPYEEFYSGPMQPPQPHIQYAQSNSDSSIDYNQILNELNSRVQGSQQEEYLPPSEEFYHWPYQPSQSPQQSAQFNSGTSLDDDMFNKLLTSLNQKVENQNKEIQNQAKKTGELEKQFGQIMEFTAQIQEQSEFSNSTVENLKEDFEIHDAITLGSAMEVGGEPKTSKPSQNMDEQLLLEEEESNKTTAMEEPPLPQLHMPSMPSTTTKVSLNSICLDPVSPNVLIPCRIMQSKEEEGEKCIFETFPKNQEQEADGECLEFIKEDTLETKIPKEVGFYDTGQVITLKTPNLAKSHIPATFKDVVFVIEFVLEQASKPSSPTSILVYTNLLILMIQVPTLEFKPLPDHVKYHRPFKDQFHAVGSSGE